MHSQIRKPGLVFGLLVGVVLPCFGTAFVRPSHADDFTVESGQTVTTTQVLDQGGDSGTIEEGGAIETSGPGVLGTADDLSVFNFGTITSTGDHGIEVTGNDFTIVNDGTITANFQSMLITGTGISVVNNGVVASDLGSLNMIGTNSSLINNGLVSSPTSIGVQTRDDSLVENNGTIVGSSVGVDLDDNSTVINTGTITALEGDGIQGADGNSITNSGLIQTLDDDVDDRAIEIDSDTTLNNSGSLISLGGAAIEVVSGTITNSGVIQGATGIQNIAGINESGLNIVNSGRIAGTDSNAILFGLSDDTLQVLQGSVIEGEIDFSGGTDTLIVDRGLSIDYSMADGGVTPGAPEQVSTNGMPFVSTDSEVVVVDPTLFAVSDEVITDITNGVHNAVHARLDQFAGGSAPLRTAASYSERQVASTAPDAGTGNPDRSQSAGGLQAWAQGFGLIREQDGSGPASDSDHVTAGLVVGADLQVSSNALTGLFFGGSRSDVDQEQDTQDEDIDSIFGGVYGRLTSGRMAFDLILSGGVTDHDREREVGNNTAPGGQETASADFDGLFIAPEVGARLDLPLSQSVTIQPGLRLRYTGFFLDGYEETGASNGLEVDDRDIHQLQGRLQLAFPLAWQVLDRPLDIVPRIGVDGRVVLDGDSVSATLLGEDLVFDPGGDDEVVGGFAGADLSLQLSEAFSLHGTVETQIEENAYSLAGYLGARISF